MTRVEGKCRCTAEGCRCQTASETWVDILSGFCRSCESLHTTGINKRWGPKERTAIHLEEVP